MATLYVLTSQGDHRVTWSRDAFQTNDPEARAAIAQAELLFLQHQQGGASAFKLKPGEPAERIDVFDSQAEETVIIPRMAGG
jgi:hypothetical protein